MIRIDFNRLRFLVIDDNAHMRRIVRTLLHGFGARDVYEAEDGAAGLDAFTHHLPDIVMTDWAMPIFDGLELTQMIRQPGANANPFVPIIMVTGHTEKERSPPPATRASPNSWRSRSRPRRSISASSTSSPIPGRSSRPRPISARTAGAIPTATYVGPERRKGGKADVIRQQALLDKARALT